MSESAEEQEQVTPTEQDEVPTLPPQSGADETSPNEPEATTDATDPLEETAVLSTDVETTEAQTTIISPDSLPSTDELMPPADATVAEPVFASHSSTDTPDTTPLHREPAPSPTNALAQKISQHQAQSSTLGPILNVAKQCRVGAIRERNEDSCLVFTSDTGGHFPLLPFGLYIVADGMGGHKNGHTASKTASRVTAHHVLNKLYVPLLRDESIPPIPIQEVMVEAATAAHRAIYDPDPDKDSGTTLTAALVLGRRLYIAHVGDSRAYLLTDNKLEAVTVDHSLVQRLQEAGQITDEDVSLEHIRHILLRALGQEEDVEVDTYMRLLPKQGSLMLCSDGLSGMVPDPQLQDILNKDMPLEERAHALYEAAMDAGGYDNITAIVVDFNF